MSKKLKEFNNFEDLNLKENLLRGIYSNGWEIPSYIQRIGIKPVLDGNDCIIQAQSGSGKTGTFSISILEKIKDLKRSCQCIILSPTREIADQTKTVIDNLSQFLNIKISGVIGGKKIDYEEARNANIIVGTPGRVFHMIRINILNMDNVKLFILDEADQMFNIGFKDSIIEIMEYIPVEAQIAIYSATMPKEILDIANKFMKNPVNILIKKNQLTLEGIKQFYIRADSEQEKYDILCELYQSLKINQSIIYCLTKRKVEWLSDKLEEEGFPVSKIHGGMDQQIRDDIMKKFRNGVNRILITTDLLARGIDVQSICLVINYDLPNNKQNYIHRIGRTGRYGKKGIAINLILGSEMRKIKILESHYATQIEEMPANIQSFF